MHDIARECRKLAVLFRGCESATTSVANSWGDASFNEILPEGLIKHASASNIKPGAEAVPSS
jgi:hypothetical protein